jgi:leucyl aminopeptidase
MAVIELNDDATYEVTEIVWQMNLPSTIRFTIPSELADAEGLDDRAGGAVYHAGPALATSVTARCLLAACCPPLAG